jgi:hypothetical protein
MRKKMTGGNYITWFKEEGSKERSLLYKLENMGVLRLQNKFREIKDDKKHYDYSWILTKKGQELVDKHESLKKIWGDGKRVDVIAFYNKVMEILKQMEEY